MEAVEGGGELLLDIGFGEEVAGKLPGDELVKGLIPLEGADDSIAPGPDLDRPVGLIAVGVGIAGQVQPVGRQAPGMLGGGA